MPDLPAAQLLRGGFDVDAADLDKEAALRWAAEYGYSGAVGLLLDKNADVTSKDDENGYTALHAAARYGHKAAAQLLLRKGASIEAKDSQGRTALALAAEWGHKEVVRLLLNKKGNIAARANDEWTPLHYAVFFEHEAVVQLLVEKGADTEARLVDGFTPLATVAKTGNEAMVGFLVKMGVDIEAKDNEGRTALVLAAEWGHKEVVRLLLDKKADMTTVDNDRWTALHYAARYGHAAVVQFLIESGIKTDAKTKKGRTALALAQENDQDEVVKLLRGKPANEDSKHAGNGVGAELRSAALSGNTALVRGLLNRGAKVNATDEDGRTALSLAAEYGHETIVKLLLERDAELETKDKADRVALWFAARYGHDAVVKLLLEKGAEVDTSDEYGQTALSTAAEEGKRKIVKLLLEKGAEVDAEVIYGKTALSFAAEQGHMAVVKLLVKKGAKVDSRSYGETPLELAAKKGHKDVVKLLREMGAKEDSEEGSEGDSDEDSEEDSDEGSEKDSEEDSEEDSDEGSEKDSEEDSEEDSDEGSEKDSEEDSEEGSQDGSKEGDETLTYALSSTNLFDETSTSNPEKGRMAELCSACLRIVSTKHKTDRETHHKTVRSFYNAATNGCYICQPIMSKLIREFQVNFQKLGWKMEFSWYTSGVPLSEPGKHRLTIFLEMKVGEKIGYNRNALGAYIFEPVSSTYDFTINVFRNVLSSNLATEIEENLLPSFPDITDPYTGSSYVWSQAMEWYTECKETHTTCNAVQTQDQWYPTRLLDVGTSQTSPVKLCISAQDHPKGPYMTLSHCWGRIPMYKLILSNITTLSKDIPLSQLPRTFVEAIEITRRLQIRYLWIDSLCIIQDSIDDWRQEAVLMEEVYSNSHCNIAATASRNGQGGLFRTRNPAHLSPQYVDASWGGKSKKRYLMYDSDMWDQLDEAPLNRRAWVLQERFLSKRIFQFGELQIFWDCHERNACEAFPRGLPPHLEVSAQTQFKRLVATGQNDVVKQAQSMNLSLKSATFYSIWDRLVRQYSRCELTMKGDKLIAIGGLAKLIQSKVNDAYLAGLWKSLLPAQLQWYVEGLIPGNQESSYRSKPYRAPTWSWASVEGPLSGIPFTCEEPQVKILEAHVALVNKDSDKGEVTDGLIRLSGKLFSGAKVVFDQYRISNCKVELRGKELSGYVYPDVCPVIGESGLYLLPIAKRGSHLGVLILKPARKRPQGYYQRFGYLEDPDKGHDSFPEGKDGASKSDYCDDNVGTIVLV